MAGNIASENPSLDMRANSPKWHPGYWLIAALPALFLFGSDGLEILMYDHARAPNAGVAIQLTLMLVFYAAWPLVPWAAWKIVSLSVSARPEAVSDAKRVVFKLAVLGGAASLLHLMLLSVVLRVLYSPPGWGVSHFVDSVVELWIQNAGLWYFVYFVFCVGIYHAVTPKVGSASDISPLIYKVRSGNQIVPVNIKDVSWIEACGNYAQLHSEKGVFLVRKSLATIEQETAEYNIVRSHRGALVNTECVSAVTRDGTDGRYWINLASGENAPLSRRRLAAFKAKLA